MDPRPRRDHAYGRIDPQTAVPERVDDVIEALTRPPPGSEALHGQLLAFLGHSGDRLAQAKLYARRAAHPGPDQPGKRLRLHRHLRRVEGRKRGGGVVPVVPFALRPGPQRRGEIPAEIGVLSAGGRLLRQPMDGVQMTGHLLHGVLAVAVDHIDGRLRHRQAVHAQAQARAEPGRKRQRAADHRARRR